MPANVFPGINQSACPRQVKTQCGKVKLDLDIKMLMHICPMDAIYRSDWDKQTSKCINGAFTASANLQHLQN
jgi:hypothetical protein